MSIKTDSNRLKHVSEGALNRVVFLSVMRYAVILTVIILHNYRGEIRPFEIVLIGIALCCHIISRPYTGLSLGYKTIKLKDSFIPLKHWMISLSKYELTGLEYKDILDNFTPATKAKMTEIYKITGKLTVYDAVNLLLFDTQHGEYSNWKHEDAQLKMEMKGRL